MKYDILNDEFVDYGTSYLSTLCNSDGESGWGVYYTQYDDSTLYITGRYSQNINVYHLKTLSYHQLNTTIPIDVNERGCMASSDSPQSRLYIAGGYNALYTFQVLNLADLSWMSSPPNMEYPRQYHGCVVVNNRLWAIGGSATDTVEAINITVLDAWQYIDSLQHNLYSFGLTEVSGLIYIVGGYGNGGPVDIVHVIDTATDSVYIHSESLHFGRYYFPTVAVGGVIYGFGGRQGLICSGCGGSIVDSWITLDLLSSRLVIQKLVLLIRSKLSSRKLVMPVLFSLIICRITDFRRRMRPLDQLPTRQWRPPYIQHLYPRPSHIQHLYPPHLPSLKTRFCSTSRDHSTAHNLLSDRFMALSRSTMKWTL